jgi:hypothetical protein
MLALVLAAVLPLLPADEMSPQSLPAQPALSGVLTTRSLTQLFSEPLLPPAGGTKLPVVEKPGVRVKKRVVCGMTVLVVDGSSDPKMVITPGGKDVDPRMPRVPKPMCGGRD